MSEPTTLLKFQIGPVQEFIAQARSTRDLWSGSYLLSWLTAAGIRKAISMGGEPVFPDPAEQPLLDIARAANENDHAALLIPNLPNLFVVRLGGPEQASAVANEIEAEWSRICTAVWDQGAHFEMRGDSRERFFAQAARLLSVSWQVTSGVNYAEAYQQNGWQLDAVRQSRNFAAWDATGPLIEKDSLSGREEAILGGDEYRKKMANWKTEHAGGVRGHYAALFAKHADLLGAVSIIKRCWHLAYLNHAHTPRLKVHQLKIRSIPAIAARQTTLDDEELPQEKTLGDRYIAAIAFDGDSIGKWVSGSFLTDTSKLETHHQVFSRAVSNFARGVREIVHEAADGTNKEHRPVKVPLGQLIYAGGDDVVALVPADAALKVVVALREAFLKATESIQGMEERKMPDGSTGRFPVRPDASAGIAIAHIKAPLQDLIRAAQSAEKRAKNTVGRPAFSITTMKRSGEISEWGARWESGGHELYGKIAALLASGDLTSRFPHRVCQLLEPYLTQRTGLMQGSDASDFKAGEIILIEFAHAVERQSKKAAAAANWQALRPMLEGYLEKVSRHLRDTAPPSGEPDKRHSEPQELLRAVIGLCVSVGFACRIFSTDSANPDSAERQSAA